MQVSISARWTNRLCSCDVMGSERDRAVEAAIHPQMTDRVSDEVSGSLLTLRDWQDMPMPGGDAENDIER